MRIFRRTILTSLLGLMLTFSASVMAQTTAPGDQKKNSESCCSMDSCCCCNGDSCDMKANAKNQGKGSCCNMKQKEAKNKTKQKSA
jgi:hypothetical protein